MENYEEMTMSLETDVAGLNTAFKFILPESFMEHGNPVVHGFEAWYQQ